MELSTKNNSVSTNTKPAFYGFVSGLMLIIFWAFLNQMKNTGDFSIIETVDVPFENVATQQVANTQSSQENTQVAVTPVPVVVPPKPAGPYKNGTYTASSSSAFGPVGIKITVQNGFWSQVRFTQLPDDSPSRYASSYLVKQALKAQSAKINGVSGATYTSDAFRDDLRKIVAQSKI